MIVRDIEYLKSLVKEIIKLPNETEWIEFKHNNDEPQMIGEYISAIANSPDFVAGSPKAFWYFILNNIY